MSNVVMSKDTKPSDVLIIGDSMIRRLQVNGHPMRVWKFCYPGGTAEEMIGHIMTEKLPGEALVGAVIINLGTNDLSRSRGRIRTVNEVFETLKSLIARMAAMYPQATIVFASILPRLDSDHDRVMLLNRKLKTHIFGMDKRFEVFDFTDTFLKTVFPGPRRVPISEYFRDLDFDTVHLSDSGTQVQQDAFNKYLVKLKDIISRQKVDLSTIMWQSEWDNFNYWNMKTPTICVNKYLAGKRLTNFKPKQHLELLELEESQKTRDMIGPLTEFDSKLKPSFKHLSE